MKFKNSLTIKKYIYKKILMLFSLSMLSATVLWARFIPSYFSKNIILLGSIQFSQAVDKELELPILYKGKEYTAKVETNGDTRKAHFELYEEEKPDEIFILITNYLAIPDDTTVLHLSTSPDHPFRLFKLILIKSTNNNEHEKQDTWQIEEIFSQKKSIIIPDNTIILFLNPEMVEKIQPQSWSSQSNIIHFPIIKLKDTFSKEMLYEIADKMKLTLLDFKFLHKKANIASIPYADNRLLSMPFTTRRSYT